MKALFVHRELISVLDTYPPGSEQEYLFFLCLGEEGELGLALGLALTQTRSPLQPWPWRERLSVPGSGEGLRHDHWLKWGWGHSCFKDGKAEAEKDPATRSRLSSPGT